MLVPRHWEKTTGSAMDPKGKRYELQLWGWSNESSPEALASARSRLADVAAGIGRGEPADSYAYGSQPVREEIIRSVGEAGGRAEAVVTRNRYGALVLNTSQVPFIDVDDPPVGIWSRVARRFRRRPSGDPTLERVREACRRNSRHSFRIYRTRAGYRVLASDMFLDPRAASTQDLLSGFAADPFFTKLCRLQGSFRARLTPKPWRCGCPLPPGRHPRDGGGHESGFAAWLAAYEAASDPFASCKYLEPIGPGRTSAETRAILQEHDDVSRALSDLPLA
jgi:hypothetical protein